MVSGSAKEVLVAGILRSSYEAISLDEIVERVLPIVENVFHTSSSLLFRNDEKGRLIPLAGQMFPLVGPYQDEGYYSRDPLDRIMQRENPVVFYSSRAPVWKEYLKGPVYREFCHPHEVDNYIQIRLTDTGHNEAGNVSLILVRLEKQPDFTRHDDQTLQRILPAMQAAVRRSLRIEEKLGAQPLLEAMLERNRSTALAVDLQGKLLWASESARNLLNLHSRGGKSPPDVLVHQARQLGALAKNQTPLEAPLTRFILSRGEKAPIRAELHLTRTRSGAPFVMVELQSQEISRILAEQAARFHLTPAETEVLHLISQGLSDEAIGRRLFVTRATVHTHAIRIFSKLGVHSRVQAALVALGHYPEVEAGNIH